MEDALSTKVSWSSHNGSGPIFLLFTGRSGSKMATFLSHSSSSGRSFSVGDVLLGALDGGGCGSGLGGSSNKNKML